MNSLHTDPVGLFDPFSITSSVRECKMGNLAQYYIPATAAIGTAMYGIDTGIIATTIGHQSFNDHMFPPDGEDAALIGKPPYPEFQGDGQS